MRKKTIKLLIFYFTVLFSFTVSSNYYFLLVADYFTIIGDSMNPTLSEFDYGFSIEKSFITRFRRFDIVVIKYNDNFLVKRIIGLPNETISYQNNNLKINDKLISDSYNNTHTYNFTTSLTENEYFLMGDNRIYSTDSRSFGPIDSSLIIAKGFTKTGKCLVHQYDRCLKVENHFPKQIV